MPEATTAPPEGAPIDSTAEEVTAAPVAAGTDVELRGPARLAVAPQADAGELVARLDTIRSAMTDAMTEDVDYGVIPGTNKPTLLKPGAEKLSVLFQLDVQLSNEQHRGPGDHLTVTSRATVFHAPTGARLGYGEGMCSTRESKYGKRQAQRVCPTCNQAAIIKGKAEYGGGWVCFKKKDGCGEKFPDDDPRIVGQQVGTVENPDLPDTWNTVLKMAEKRARIDAVLAVTGASALFTQDMEDAATGQPAPSAPAELPAWATAASDDEQNKARLALAELLDRHGDLVKTTMQTLAADAGGDLSMLTVRTLLRVAVARRQIANAHASSGDVSPGPADAEPVDAEVVQTTPAPAAAPGTVDVEVDLSKPIKAVEAWRAAGCICEDPLNETSGRDAKCPVRNHGIPF